MNLQELKDKSPADLISEAEKLGVENPSTLRKREILFAQTIKKRCLKSFLKLLGRQFNKVTGSPKTVNSASLKSSLILIKQ